MTGITTYLSILTLNANGLNTPQKKTLSGKLDLQETHLIDRNKQWLKVKGWKKI
jgi:hypothetical protein